MFINIKWNCSNFLNTIDEYVPNKILDFKTSIFTNIRLDANLHILSILYKTSVSCHVILAKNL